jgi:hypothetical protein
MAEPARPPETASRIESFAGQSRVDAIDRNALQLAERVRIDLRVLLLLLLLRALEPPHRWCSRVHVLDRHVI